MSFRIRRVQLINRVGTCMMLMKHHCGDRRSVFSARPSPLPFLHYSLFAICYSLFAICYLHFRYSLLMRLSQLWHLTLFPILLFLFYFILFSFYFSISCSISFSFSLSSPLYFFIFYLLFPLFLYFSFAFYSNN